MTEQVPSVGRTVHYVARGSADGVFKQVCRAAIITEVCGSTVMLAVLNPTGIFFGESEYDPTGEGPGSWHWPERI